MEIQYNGENLWLGIIGNLFISLSFSAAILSTLAYCMAGRNELIHTGWKRLGRIGFMLHSVGVLGIISTLFYILLSHRFEYHYAWQHSSRDLPSQYVFAAFWEGQEGSFLLWTFWHVVIGNILIWRSREWEPYVMAIFSVVQVFLASMVIGAVIDIPGIIQYKIGSNPFLLTREHPSMAGLPFLNNPDYLLKLDGRGLNPSLQNYWMTIHPPTLFLGFALTLVPYAYALAGIANKKYTEWFAPALPWTFVGIAVLGTGILMGGAWAYEALNFGGFWAWDPVENSSLVPWLTLVGGGHLMLIKKNKGTSLFVAFFLIIISFVLILYSTFLTRSGVLGDASVHSFTDLGMTGQLLMYLFFFMWLPVVLIMPSFKTRLLYSIFSLVLLLLGFYLNFNSFIKIAYFIFGLVSLGLAGYLANRYFPQDTQGESAFSREFFMFIGSLLLLISGLHLTFETSKPVINKLIGTNYAPGSIDTYNKVQAVLAILITVMMGVSQFLLYKKNILDVFWGKIMRSIMIAAGLTLLAGLVFKEFNNPQYILLCFASGFTVIANADYIIRYLTKNLKMAGASLAHIGFGMIILGAVISAGHKKFISQNVNRINLESLNPDFKNNENIMLHRGDTVPMYKYYLSYQGDTLIGNVAYYRVDYFTLKNGRLEKAFTLYPKLIMNERMGNSPEPATKHFIDKDIFTHVTYVDVEKLKRKKNNEQPQYTDPQHFTIQEKDTVFGTRFYVVFEGLQAETPLEESSPADSLFIQLKGVFSVYNVRGQILDRIYSQYEIRNNYVYTKPGIGEETGLKIELERINPKERTVEVNMAELKGGKMNDFIIMQAIIFPGINILWAGCVLMVIGIFLSVFYRLTQKTMV
ncbi:MAG: cytochrome c biogenesis protein CcsA [Flavobacteriales bacterium]|nr:cytochrome c biogenesis protein CcsA [Flavobacteriales bacterium]